MSTLRTNWKGVFPAAVTPFAEDGTFDEGKTRDLIDLLIEEGVHGIIVAGSTGEWFSLDFQEQVRLFEIAKEQSGGRVTVIGGTSAIGTREAVNLTRAAKDVGLDGCMVLPPPYALPTASEVVAHFEAIAKVGLPLMAYNNPTRTGINLDARMATQIAAFDAVVAFKDSTKDLYQMSETILAVGDRLAMFAGLEPYGLGNIHRGAVGIVSTIANVCARDVVEYYEHAAAGRWGECAPGQGVIDRLYHLMAHCGVANYSFVKEAMAVLGRPGGFPRRPYLPMDAATRQKLVSGLAAIPLKGPDGRKAVVAE